MNYLAEAGSHQAGGQGCQEHERELLSYAYDFDFLKSMAIAALRKYNFEPWLPPVEELINEAFIQLCEAIPRYDPARWSLRDFAISTILGRMKCLIETTRCRLSEREYIQIRTREYYRRRRQGEAVSLPRVVSVNEDLDRAAKEDQGEPAALATVRALLAKAPNEKDRALLELYLQHSGNLAAIAQEMGWEYSGLYKRFQSLFQRAAQPQFPPTKGMPAWVHDFVSGKVQINESALSPQEREIIRAIRDAGGNLAEASRQTGMIRETFALRLKRILQPRRYGGHRTGRPMQSLIERWMEGELPIDPNALSPQDRRLLTTLREFKGVIRSTARALDSCFKTVSQRLNHIFASASIAPDTGSPHTSTQVKAGEVVCCA